MQINQAKKQLIIGDRRGELMIFSEKASRIIVPMISDVLEIIENCKSYDSDKKYTYTSSDGIITITFNQIVFENLLTEITVGIEDLLRSFDAGVYEDVISTVSWARLNRYTTNRSISVIYPGNFIENLHRALIDYTPGRDPYLIAGNLLAGAQHNFVRTLHIFENPSDPLSVAEELKRTVAYDDDTPIQRLDYSIYGADIILFIAGSEDAVIGYVHCQMQDEGKDSLLLIRGFKNGDGFSGHTSEERIAKRIIEWLKPHTIDIELSDIISLVKNTHKPGITKSTQNVGGRVLEISHSPRTLAYCVILTDSSGNYISREFNAW